MQSATLPPSEVFSLVKGFKYPIYPTESQKELFAKTFGSCRYVWNRALAQAKFEYEYYLTVKDTNQNTKMLKPNVSGYGFVNKLVSYKNDVNSLWLNKVSSVALQQTMLQLGGAFSTFLKNRKGYPKFKKRSHEQSFSLVGNGFRIKGNRLYIVKSKEPLVINWTRKLPSCPTSCTISLTPTGQYYISFTAEYYPVPTTGTGEVGLDLGLKDLITVSNGTKVANPKHLRQRAKQLKRKQQSLSRKQKGSKNHNKARLIVAKVHAKITNTRKDFHHKLSRTLINENQVIGLEKLMVKNMIKNRKLSKSISDAGWSSFTKMLEYKAKESQHCKIVYMDTWYPSSHICHVDGYKLDRKLSLADRSWICPHCNTKHDRDVNAAINIRNEALKAIARVPASELANHAIIIADNR